ncbi:hypothetical protein PSAC2689_100092 [Paraburkholderia sacchari]
MRGALAVGKKIVALTADGPDDTACMKEGTASGDSAGCIRGIQFGRGRRLTATRSTGWHFTGLKECALSHRRGALPMVCCLGS